ncbi:MAG: fibrobacter succinogenes major paralogous domain-containing protein [Saprospiraceae bacterium]|nr:fibrobacter succinogenes major paralogous domain-containing protein [Saprospiraceae bacterium]
MVFNVTLLWPQEEKLQVDGAIKLGQSEDPTPEIGTIQWNGNDFVGWNGVIWVSLTGGAVTGKVFDIDANEYLTIKIGELEWMTTNLRTSRYRAGTPIDQVSNDMNWTNLTAGAYCWYNNLSSNELPYGKLYNWFAISGDSLCPSSWHVATDSDWTNLIDVLDPVMVDPGAVGTQSTVAGSKLKEAGTSHWSQNSGATNQSGFTGVPGGFRDTDGIYYSLSDETFLWTATTDGMNAAFSRFMSKLNSHVHRLSGSKVFGYSVRCVKN